MLELQEWIVEAGLLEMNETTVVVRLLQAVLCGGAMGFERMRKLRAAGLRTYMLVCLGACMTMIVGAYVSEMYDKGDPTRISAQVISGIGFIGAGTIMLTGYNRIKGLTTAAGLWANAAMGLAIGAGMYISGFAMLAILLLSVTLGSKVQDYCLSRSHRLRIYVLLDEEKELKDMLHFLKEHDMHITDFESRIITGACVGLNMTLDIPRTMKHAEAFSLIQDFSGAAFLEEI